MKIVVTGTESTGKTTLSEDLAQSFEIAYVSEFAREYLMLCDGKYDFSDLIKIARGQHKTISEVIGNQKLIITDTDLLTIKIWSEFKYGKCDPWIVETLYSNKPDLYLLCATNIPWEADPLRENPNDREELHKIYQQEIKHLEVSCVEIFGDREQRLTTAINAIEELKNKI